DSGSGEAALTGAGSGPAGAGITVQAEIGSNEADRTHWLRRTRASGQMPGEVPEPAGRASRPSGRALGALGLGLIEPDRLVGHEDHVPGRDVVEHPADGDAPGGDQLGDGLALVDDPPGDR